MAPEVLNGAKYNYKVDMWSLGSTLFEFLTGTTPFNGKDKDELVKNVNFGIVRFPKKLNLSHACMDFLGKTLQIRETKRMTIDHAKNHPFINKELPQYL